MAKTELAESKKLSVDAILSELCGYSIDEAERILKAVAAQIRKCAIIEEAQPNG